MRQTQSSGIHYRNKNLSWRKAILCPCFARTAQLKDKAELGAAVPWGPVQALECCSITHHPLPPSKAAWPGPSWSAHVVEQIYVGLLRHCTGHLLLWLNRSLKKKAKQTPCMCCFPIRDNKFRVTDNSYATYCLLSKRSRTAVEKL